MYHLEQLLGMLDSVHYGSVHLGYISSVYRQVLFSLRWRNSILTHRIHITTPSEELFLSLEASSFRLSVIEQETIAILQHSLARTLGTVEPYPIAIFVEPIALSIWTVVDQCRTSFAPYKQHSQDSRYLRANSVAYTSRKPICTIWCCTSIGISLVYLNSCSSCCPSPIDVRVACTVASVLATHCCNRSSHSWRLGAQYMRLASSVSTSSNQAMIWTKIN